MKTSTPARALPLSGLGRGPRTVLPCALLAVLLVAPPAAAQAAADLPTLLATARDEARTLVDREKALNQAAAQARRTGGAAGQALVAAVVPLLGSLQGKRASADHERLVRLAFRSLEQVRPVPDLTATVKPFLRMDARRKVRDEAARTVWVHGTTGLVEDLAIHLRDLAADDPGRGATESMFVDAGAGLPEPDGTQLLALVLAHGRSAPVRAGAATALGQRSGPEAKAALAAAASPAEEDEVVACEAALALDRLGGSEGTAELVRRLKAGRPSALLYRALCRAAHRPSGFGGVPPEVFHRTSPAARAVAEAEVATWWEGARGRTPEDRLLDALAQHGVRVPKDRRGKEAVTAFIDGLDVEPPALRYAALDRLVALTGRRDLAAGFRTLQRALGGRAALREVEPDEGFPDEERREALRAQQRRDQERWRSWWRDAAPRAQRVGEAWVVPG